MNNYIDRLEAELLRGYNPPRRRHAPVLLAGLATIAAGALLVSSRSHPVERSAEPPAAAEVMVGEIQRGIKVRRDSGLICLDHLDNEVCASEDQYASGVMFGSRPGNQEDFFGLAPADVNSITVHSTDGRTAAVEPHDGVWDVSLPPDWPPIENVTVTARRSDSATATATNQAWSADDYVALRSRDNLSDPPPFIRLSDQVEVHRLLDTDDAMVWAWAAGGRICLAATAFLNAGGPICSPADEPLPPRVIELSGGRVAVLALLPDGASAFLANYPGNAIEGLPIRRNLVSGVVRASVEKFTWRAPDGTFVSTPR